MTTEQETDRNRGTNERTAFTRRRFLVASGAVALGSLLAACGDTVTAPTVGALATTGAAVATTAAPTGAALATTGAALATTAAPAVTAAVATVGTTAMATTGTTAMVAAKPIKGTKLTILWQPASIPEAEAAMNKLMDDWAKQSGVELSKEVSSEYTSRLATMAETKQGADLVHLGAQDVAVNESVMMDVGDLAMEMGTKMGGYYDGPKSVAVRPDGKWKAVPALVYGQYWLYRQDLLKQAGLEKPPETWEELHQLGKKTKAMDKPVGFVLGHAFTDGSTHTYSLMWDYGAKEFEADGKTLALNSKEMMDCLTFFQTFYKDSCAENSFGWDEAGNNNAYNTGQIVATNNANTIYVGLTKNNAALAMNSIHGSTLKGPAGGFQYMAMLFWGIPTYSKNPDAAKAFLREAFYTPEFQTLFTKAGNGYNLPAFGLLDNVDGAWPTDPKLASARTLAKTARMLGSPGPLTKVVGASQNKFIIIDMFAKVAQGSSPKDAIAFAVNEYNVLLKGA